jgi:hypothetical protein
MSAEHADDRDPARALVEELLGTGLMLVDVLSSLIEELPPDAFPGEDNAAVLVEMVVGTCRPVVDAAGASSCFEAVALIGAVGDRVRHDLRRAAEEARRRTA